MQLHGYCLDPRSACLVYPLMRGGSLEDRLLPTPAGAVRLALLGGAAAPLPLPWQVRFVILRDLLRAIAHLHGASPRVLHRDVKASNVLLDTACVAWLASFYSLLLRGRQRCPAFEHGCESQVSHTTRKHRQRGVSLAGVASQLWTVKFSVRPNRHSQNLANCSLKTDTSLFLSFMTTFSGGEHTVVHLL